MKKLFNYIKNEILAIFKHFQEILTLDFIAELVKKPSFILWSIIIIVAFVFFLINGGPFKIIQILAVAIMFYFFFFRK